MPQLDTTYFVSQFFWLAVLFSLFYLCVRFLIMPRLEWVIHARKNLKQESDSFVGLLDLEITEMRIEIKAKSEAVNVMIKSLEEDAISRFDSYSKELSDKLYKAIEKETDLATKEVSEMGEKILGSKEMNDSVTQSASNMISKITNLDVSSIELKQLIKS